RVRELGIPLFLSSQVTGTLGDERGRLRRVAVRSALTDIEIEADLLAVSGGHDPNLNLHLQRRGGTTYDASIAAAVPTDPLPGQSIAGAARGARTLADCLRDGADGARAALAGVVGLRAVHVVIPEAADTPDDVPSPLTRVDAPDGDETRSFVDLHRDATVAGVQRAVNAGVRHIEHVKRFTLVGTGVEQGRASKTNAGLLTASLTDRPAADVGTSGSRPPYEPLPFALMAGRARGERYDPRRTTSLHAIHEALGAVVETAGQWMRPSRYPRLGERARETVARECRAARERVALMDASTLGKIDVRGPDAAWFLDQLYVNAIASIPVGHARYSVMCHLDGSILDDGVVMRIGEQRFFVTTSTGHAAAVVEWMEEWLQTEWPERRVWVTSITEQWATIAVVGPRAREVVANVSPGFDVSSAAFPFHTVRRGVTVAGIADAQLARVSFSGELSYEISVPWHEATTVWNALLDAGAAHDIMPYGLDALQQLRMEKGFIIVGQDTEALTTPHDVGLGWMVDKEKGYVGRRSTERAANRRDDRAELVGFTVLESDEVLPEGAALTRVAGSPPMPIDGHVSSSGWSETLGKSLGLALVRGGRRRIGELLDAPLLDGRVARVRLVSPVQYDPKGARRDG
ncbi:MAG: glycine cleavage T C-terminal barrel domain-containing protein, partial [Gemmatimonadota bacterium]